MTNKEVMVGAGKVKGKRVVIKEPLFPVKVKSAPLRRTVFRSEVETFTSPAPGAARLHMTGVLP